MLHIKLVLPRVEVSLKFISSSVGLGCHRDAHAQIRGGCSHSLQSGEVPYTYSSSQQWFPPMEVVSNAHAQRSLTQPLVFCTHSSCPQWFPPREVKLRLRRGGSGLAASGGSSCTEASTTSPSEPAVGQDAIFSLKPHIGPSSH